MTGQVHRPGALAKTGCTSGPCRRPFFGPDSQVLGTVTVFHDVTRFKELDEMKNDFVRMVSHELRSPLAAIKQQHAVILDGLAGELDREAAGAPHPGPGQDPGSARPDQRPAGRGQDGSGLRPVGAGAPGSAANPEGTGGALRAKADSQRVTLHLELPPDLPLIRADRRSMEEVFTNLVSNAINYSPDGGDVTIAAVSHGDYLEVAGAGPAASASRPRKIPKIFDKFYRVKNPKTRQVIGTGLGLSLVKGLVEAHRGSVDVESQVGVGTTFRVLLPTVAGEKGSDAGE